MTRMVECNLGKTGKHPITIAVRENDALAYIQHKGCGASGEAMERLGGGDSCAKVVQQLIAAAQAKADTHYRDVAGFASSRFSRHALSAQAERSTRKPHIDVRPATERLNEMRSHTASAAAGFPLVVATSAGCFDADGQPSRVSSIGISFANEKRPMAHYYQMQGKGWFAEQQQVLVAHRVNGHFVFDEERMLELARFRYATESGCPACGIAHMAQTKARKHSECGAHKRAVVAGVRRAIVALGKLGKGGAK